MFMLIVKNDSTQKEIKILVNGKTYSPFLSLY